MPLRGYVKILLALMLALAPFKLRKSARDVHAYHRVIFSRNFSRDISRIIRRKEESEEGRKKERKKERSRETKDVLFFLSACARTRIHARARVLNYTRNRQRAKYDCDRATLTSAIMNANRMHNFMINKRKRCTYNRLKLHNCLRFVYRQARILE
jgi:hypothetical protein